MAMRRIFNLGAVIVSIFIAWPGFAAPPKSFIQRCLARLNPMKKPMANPKKLSAEHRRFVDGTASRRERPPTENATESTTLWDLTFDFQYWWYPGNIWYSSMQPRYDGLANQVQSHQTVTLPEPGQYEPTNRDTCLGQWQDPVGAPAPAESVCTEPSHSHSQSDEVGGTPPATGEQYQPPATPDPGPSVDYSSPVDTGSSTSFGD